MEGSDYFTFLGKQEDSSGGLALCVTSEWKERLHSVRKVSGHVAPATFKYSVGGGDRLLAVVSVHGYTQVRRSREPCLVLSFSKELSGACEYERRPADTVVVAGHFSAKLGCREVGEEYTVGKCEAGARSQSGEELKELLVQAGLYTASEHSKDRRVQTATGGLRVV